MENGKKGENCKFVSYIGDSGGRGRPAGEGAYLRRSGQQTPLGGTARRTGIFAEVRRMRREDEAREARIGSLRSLRRKRAAEPSAAAQAGKFAVLLACICAFSLIFALKTANSNDPGEALAVFRTAMNGSGGEREEDEKLGRLKLVRLPGLLSVFAASDHHIAPLSADRAVTDDSFTARLFAAAGSEVVSMLSGSVRSVDPAGEHGGSVTVACNGGVDITYMGLGEILVERGQPVLQRTVLGRLSGEILYLRITKDGRPMDPLEFLGTAARVG